MMNTLGNFGRLPRDVQLNAWAWFLYGVGYFGIFGVIFNLYLRRLGLGTETIGLLTAVGLLAWGLGAVPAGIIGGHVGNRKAILSGSTLSGIGMALLVLVGFLPARMQVGWMALCWVATWLGASLSFVNNAPWIMGIVTPEERSNAFAAQMLMQNLGGFIGSLVAGVLPIIAAKWVGVSADSATAYWLPLWLVPVTFFGALWLYMLTDPTVDVIVGTETSSVAKIPYPILLFVLVLTFLQISGAGLIRPFFNLYLDAGLAMPLAQIGFVFAIAQVLPILTALAAPWLLARWGAVIALILIGIANCACFLILASIVTWPAAVLAYIAFMSIIPIANIVNTVFSQEIVAARWRTSMSTAYTIGTAMGQAFFASLGGFLIAGLGYTSLFFAGAGLSLLFVLLVWGYLRMGGSAKAAAVDPAQ
jgi:MFS family permease